MRFISRLLVLVVLAAIVILAALLFVPRFNHTTVVELPTAEAPDGRYVGVGEPRDEVAMVCPVGIALRDAKSLALLDSDTLRVLDIDVEAQAVASADPVAIPATAGPQAMAFSDGALWVWVEDATRESKGAVPFVKPQGGAYAPGLPQGFDGRIQPRGEAARLFADLGYGSNDEADATDSYPGTPGEAVWTETVASAEGRTVTAQFAMSGHSLTVDLGGGGTFALNSSRTFLSARLLKATNAGQVFLLTSSWEPHTTTIDVHDAVVELKQGASKPVVYDVPLQEGDCVAKQTVAVSDKGEVYALRVRTAQVAVLRLLPRTWLQDLVQEIEAFLDRVFPGVNRFIQALMPEARAQVAQTADSSGAKTIARADMIGNACTYLKHTWKPVPAQLDISRWKVGASGFPLQKDLCACSDTTSCWTWKKSTIVQQVIDTAAAQNQEASYKGLPYNWGGFDKLADFDRKIAANRPAGDLCTSKDGAILDASDPTRTFAAGVDCSGFVGRAWGYAGADRPFTTSSLGNARFTAPLAQSAMRPGDVVNKAGSHVRMVRGWRPATQRPTDKIWTFESKTGDCKGVCARIYTLSELNTYEPLRSTKLKTPDPPLDADTVNCR